MSYRDLQDEEKIREGDEVWNPAHRMWFSVPPDGMYIGRRADETDMWWRRPLPDEPQQRPAPVNKYHRTITQTIGDDVGLEIVVDVYDVLTAFAVTCPAIQHAIKKLLCPGQRGSKSAAQDLREAVVSIERAIQLTGGQDHDE